MKNSSMRWKEILQLTAFLLFFALTAALNLNCSSDDSNPASDPACGSGNVAWDDKGQVCRDQVNNKIVPSSCCGK
ncbi:MAG: hypothetical protein NTU47_12445 [Ignavibacteriales bacterium]|nr:hypothetical protein [Ignavibacteriales bacterium]